MNNPPFKIGQKVVCIKRFSWNDIKVGEHYTVKSIKQCCGKWSVDVGVGKHTACYKCHKLHSGSFKNALCFAPIDEQKERIRYVAVSESLREIAVEIAAVETN